LSRGTTHPVVAYEITQKTPIFNIIVKKFNTFYRTCAPAAGLARFAARQQPSARFF
jgi:hypothetical protein